MSKATILQQLGLSSLEAKVYLAALELGVASMQELATKSKVKRTSIYSFLDKLKDQGFIIETKKRKRNMYSAMPPEQLLEVQKARVQEFQKTLPEFLAIYNKSSSKPRVLFFEGIEGIKEVYTDTLVEKKPIIGWSDFEHMKSALGTFYEEYPRERARRSLTFKTIVRDSPTARAGAKKDYGLLRETKFISSGDLKTEINVYGNKVALMSFRSSPPFVVLIEDADIAETLRVAWKNEWDRM